jgi:hypothetical protein
MFSPTALRYAWEPGGPAPLRKPVLWGTRSRECPRVRRGGFPTVRADPPLLPWREHSPPPSRWTWGRSLCFEAIMSDLCRHVIGSRAGSDRPRGHCPRFRFSSKARRGMSWRVPFHVPSPGAFFVREVWYRLPEGRDVQPDNLAVFFVIGSRCFRHRTASRRFALVTEQRQPAGQAPVFYGRDGLHAPPDARPRYHRHKVAA